MPEALLASVDSDRRPAHIPRLGGLVVRVVDGAPVLRGEALVALAEDGFFNGFDEVWVLPEGSESLPPADASLVYPFLAEGPLPGPLSSWIEQSGARLGVGDGFGLNLVVADNDLAATLDL
jgi:hypothetical protein